MGFLSQLFGGKPLPPTPDLPFECLVVPGRDALARREALLHGAAKPVILGDPAEAARFRELMDESDEDVAALVARALALDADGWIAAQLRESEGFEQVPAGSWPSDRSVGSTGIAAHLNVLTRRPLPAVAIGLVPAAQWWEIPAHVRFGGWNACPPTEVHLALHKRWEERHGARIASMTFDVIECTVERPPASRDEAMALAREHFLYCEDIVHQGVETIENLAATLMKSRAWYFWWD